MCRRRVPRRSRNAPEPCRSIISRQDARSMTDSVSLATVALARQRKLRIEPLWLALPGIVFLVLFLLLPTAQMLSRSLFDKVTGALTLAAFARIWNGGPYLAVLSTTFSVAFWTTLLCLTLGYPLAYWLCCKSPRQQRIAMLFVLLPFWTSALIKNFSWLVLLGRNGIMAKIMASAGMTGGDQLLFSRTTVVFAMTHTLLPLAVVTMLPVMNQIDRRLPMAAATLGASGAQAFWQIFYQLSMRGVAAAGLLVFVASLGFFITPALLGGPRETMIGQLIILQINELQNWQLGSALAAILLVSAIAMCMVYDRIFGLSSVSEGSERQTSPGGLARLAGLAAARFAGLVFGAIEEFWKRNIRGLRGSAILSIYAWVVIAVLLVPIIAFVPMAFTRSTFLSFPPQGFSLQWFEQFMASPVAWRDDPILRHRSRDGGNHRGDRVVRRAGLGPQPQPAGRCGVPVVLDPDGRPLDRHRDRPVLPVCPGLPGGDQPRDYHRAHGYRHPGRIRDPVGHLQGTRLAARCGGVDTWG